MQVKAKLKLSGVAEIYFSSVSARLASNQQQQCSKLCVSAVLQNKCLDSGEAITLPLSSDRSACCRLQNGQKVRSVSELQDIDELCVVEVRATPAAAACISTSSTTLWHRCQIVCHPYKQQQ